MIRILIQRVLALVFLGTLALGVSACVESEKEPQFKRTKSIQKANPQTKKDSMQYTSNRKMMAQI
jgi:hypothetical protein